MVQSSGINLQNIATHAHKFMCCRTYEITYESLELIAQATKTDSDEPAKMYSLTGVLSSLLAGTHGSKDLNP